MSWVSFWDASPSIYVSPRHKAVHYETIARQIAGHVPGPGARILDYGAGEALSARLVAARSARLVLVDAAPSVVAGLAKRFADEPKIEARAPAELEATPDRAFDLIIVNSVVQYLARAEFERNLDLWRRLLAPGGTLLFADIIPPGLGAVGDAAQLLRLAARERFLVDALIGLARTAVSDCRKLRAKLGLATFTETEFVAVLMRHGLDARRVRPNLGHNQSRMAFAARHVA